MSRRKNPSANDSLAGSSPLEPLTDGEAALLVKNFCVADNDAVARIWHEYGPKFAVRLKKRWPSLAHDRCEEIALDAVSRACDRGAQFDIEKGCFEAWLWRITYRRALQELRKPWLQQCLLEVSLAPEKTVAIIYAAPACLDEEADDQREAVDRNAALVQRAMLVLSDVERTILTADMNSAEGSAPSRELGEQLGLPASTIRCHRARARLKLKEELLRLGYRSPAGGRG